MKAKSRSKFKAPKTGYRAQAAKRLQTPNFQPDPEEKEQDDEEENEDGSYPVYQFPGGE